MNKETFSSSETKSPTFGGKHSFSLNKNSLFYITLILFFISPVWYFFASTFLRNLPNLIYQSTGMCFGTQSLSGIMGEQLKTYCNGDSTQQILILIMLHVLITLGLLFWYQKLHKK